MQRQVAIISRNSIVLVNRVAAGIGEQFRLHPDWHFQFFPHVSATLDALAKAKLDGAIAIGMLDEDFPLLHGLRGLSVPLVHAGELHVDNAFHQVTMTNLSIGALGASHLLDTGVRHFAFVGQGGNVARHRCLGFVQTLNKAGFSDVPILIDARNTFESLGEFLRQLPRPVGIMTDHDRVGWDVARHAFGAGIGIPDQLALIGVGNEDPWCTLATPPLSSIDVPAREMGRLAAIMLDDLMNGRPTPRRIDLSTARVAERHSTAIAHAEQPDIAAAISFIRQNYATGITVEDVAGSVGISRSTLQVGIKQVLGRTPLQEILRLRFAAARDMLANSDVPMKIVARRCGFTDNKHFSTSFRASQGMSPRQYRDSHRSYHATRLEPRIPHRRAAASRV